MIKFTKKYNDKIDSCIRALTLMGTDRDKIVESYSGVKFPKSRIDKCEMFRNILNKRLSCPQFQYLTDLCSLARYRDKRCPHEYGVDLILGWLVEDAVLNILTNSDHSLRLYGEDKGRVFLESGKISAIPDIELDTDDGKRYIEVFTDWTNIWKKKNHADLRYDKYPCLVEHKAFLLGISPLSKTGFYIDLSIDCTLFKKEDKTGYSKPGYVYKGIRDKLVGFDDVIAWLKSL